MSEEAKKGRLLPIKEPRFFAEGHKIFMQGRNWMHDDGSQTLELTVPILEVTEFVKERDEVAAEIAALMCKHIPPKGENDE